MQIIQLYKEEIAEIKQLFIKAELDIDNIDFIYQKEYEFEYQIMYVTVSGDYDKMEQFIHRSLEDFKEQHQANIGVDYMRRDLRKGRSIIMYEFWRRRKCICIYNRNSGAEWTYIYIKGICETKHKPKL